MHHAALPLQPRARGALEIATKPAPGGGTALARLRQQGALRALFPRGGGLTAVALNTSGGVTGGDRFTVTAEAAADTRLTVTTQAAERLYRAQPGETGRIETRLTVGAGARLDWVPQETIVFDGAAVDRRLGAEVAPDGTLVIVEPLVLGRTAMGERVQDLRLRDRITVMRAGEMVFADRIAMTGDAAAIMAHPATGGGAGALAALIVITPQAERHLEPLRQLLVGAGGVSLIRPGVCFARVIAPDSFELRKSLLPALAQVGVALPRVWSL